MNKLAYFGALASLSVAATAQAQDASKAFQCDLPYRDTMMAMGSLEVLSQTPVKPFPGLHGDGELIDFATAGTLVYGQTPKQLTLEFLQPHSGQPRKKFTVSFSAKFAPSTATDEAIQQQVEWHIQCGALTFCIRSSATRPEGGGRMEYRRKDEFVLQCIFEFTPEEFEAIGN
jgi:hypothetical protein